MTDSKIPKKPSAKKPQTIVKHICVQEKKIIQMHKAVTGNGNPEEGLQFQVLLLNKNNKALNESIKEINGSLNIIKDKYDETIEVANSAKNAIERYQAEGVAVDIAIEKLKVQRQSNRAKWFQIVTILITFAGIVISALIGFKNDNNLERRIDNLGVPVITNPRGQKIDLPEGSSVKMFPNDFINDTVKIK